MPRKLHTQAVFIFLATASLLSCQMLPKKEQPQDLGKYLETQGYQVIQLEKLPTGHEMVRIRINGVAGLFILDSGASNTVLHNQRIAKFQLNINQQKDSGEAIGAGGTQALTSLPIDSFQLNGQDFPLKQLFAMDLGHVVSSFTEYVTEPIDGVLGQDILTAHHAILDIAASKLFLKPRAQLH